VNNTLHVFNSIKHSILSHQVSGYWLKLTGRLGSQPATILVGTRQLG